MDDLTRSGTTMTASTAEGADGQAPHGSAPTRSPADQAIAGAIFLVATVVVAGLGSAVNSAGMDWYDSLEQPSIAPPGATFGIVWTILYALIALSGWLAWRATSRAEPTIAWGVQMALNLAWTSVFFGLESIGGGLVVIGLLIVAVAASIFVVWRVSRVAALLLVPYLGWVCFAAILNAAYASENFV